jgi:hypothetical protein
MEEIPMNLFQLIAQESNRAYDQRSSGRIYTKVYYISCCMCTVNVRVMNIIHGRFLFSIASPPDLTDIYCNVCQPDRKDIHVISSGEMQSRTLHVCKCDGVPFAVQILRFALFPCSPCLPTAAVTLRTLENYHKLFLRAHVSIESYWDIITVLCSRKYLFACLLRR